MSDIKEKVKIIQENFNYTQLTSLKDDVNIGWKNIQSEVWHCGENESSVYAFDICIMPMGIAVCGDIGELTFNVYNRGIDFLAGNDIEYYIHSKLSPGYKIEQFDTKKFNSYVMESIFSDFEDKEFISYEVYKEFEKLVEDKNFTNFFDKCKMMYFVCDVSSAEHDYLCKLFLFIQDIEEVIDDRSAHEVLYNTNFLSFDSCEYNFTEMDNGLWFKLNMINHAAKEIMKIKGKK